MLLKNSLEKLMKKQSLDALSCAKALRDILTKKADPLQAAAFLVLLRAKTETAEELSSMISVLHEQMISLSTGHTLLDIVGTGGDEARTINISTGSAILAASCGVKIAKHGNRAVSSLSGSADVLEALGINIHASPEKISAGIDAIGIGFCFFPHFHPAMLSLRDLRKQLGVPTTFNLLGPLLNPAHPKHILLGVLHESLLPLMASTLQKMGTKKSMVVHGCGLDEISCIGPSKIMEITQNGITEFTLEPKKLGFSLCTLEDLQGGDADTNAKLLLGAFSLENSKKSKAIRDTLILNAAVALYLYGLSPSIFEAINHATEKLQSGSAMLLLEKWRKFSHE